MIERTIKEAIEKQIGKGKTIVIYGARQVGKTTLLHQIFDGKEDVLWLNGDNINTKKAFADADIASLAPIVEGHKTVIVDEAQRIENIGLKLKILHDNLKSEIQFVATGSSSFELANKISEPMTGRKRTFWLHPLSIGELVQHSSYLEEKSNLENRLRYGSYPDIVSDLAEAQANLTDLASDKLYKDVLLLGDVLKPNYLDRILQALALQVGNQVNYSELSNLIGLDRKTIEKYIALLEQSFIIFELPSFSRNLRNELKNSRKIYFYDTGIRNAIINDFRPANQRQDVGAVFENYVVSELKKIFIRDNVYFWRNFNQQEIDFILEKDGEIIPIEVKYNPKKTAKTPSSFKEKYHPADLRVINSDNYLDYFMNISE